jgi:hypothetical protein
MSALRTQAQLDQLPENGRRQAAAQGTAPSQFRPRIWHAQSSRACPRQSSLPQNRSPRGMPALVGVTPAKTS